MLGKAAEQRAGSGRMAWLVCFAVPMVLLAILGAPRAAGDPTSSAAGSPSSEPAIQLSDEGEWEGACVELEEEGEEAAEAAGEECEAEEEEEAEEVGFSPAEDCYLRTARSHVVAYPQRGRVRLTLGYTTFESTPATVELNAGDGDRLAVVRRHLGRSGVIRLSRHIGDDAMARLEGSHSFTVTVHVAEAPGACQHLETERLQVANSNPTRITWADDRAR
jgi:hypothetical protein